MGNLCGLSTGEALSRWCAMAVSNNALADFATGPTWYSSGMPNFVDSTDPTDQNADSTGCGMVFISWLIGSQGYGLATIAQQMVKNGDTGTLAKLYPMPAHAWTDFQAAIAALPGGISTDDPFGALGAPVPQPQPVPTPTPTPTPTPEPTPGTSALELAVLIGQALFADLGNGADEPTMKADIQAILDAN